jgi:predicted anti-sigma-YlaC factor YlaD
MRAREAASARLDDELTELDVLRLEAHLRRCPACREFAADAAALTAELRRAPLERPAAAVFQPRRRTRVSALRVQAAAAAVVALAATGSLALGRLAAGGGGPRFTSSSPVGDLSSARQDAVEQRLLALLPGPRRSRMLVRNGPVVPL